MSIHQMQISFSQEEDRLLFRVSTIRGEEFRVWFSRRFIKAFWPNLLNALQHQVVAKTAGNVQAAQSLLGLQQQQALSQAEFGKPYQHYEEQEPLFPLGETPLVVCKATLTQKNNGDTVMGFYNIGEQGFEITMARDHMFAFMKMIYDCTQISDWDISITLPTADGEAQTMAEEKPRYLN